MDSINWKLKRKRCKEGRSHEDRQKGQGGQDKNNVGRKEKDDGGGQAQLENEGTDVTSNYKAKRSANTVKS